MTSAAPKAMPEPTEQEVQQPDWEGIRKQLDAGQRGIELKTFDDMYRFAQHVAKSDLVPTQMRNPSNAIVAMQYGAELGVSPMVSLQKCAVIDGRPTFETVLLLGLCLRSGKLYTPQFKQWTTGTPYEDDYAWHCQVQRIDGKILGEPKVGSFSVDDAKRADLWDKKSSTGKKMPWQKYAKDMLCNRATLRALKWAFPDVLYGVYGTEEMEVDKLMGAIDFGDEQADQQESDQGELQGIREQLTKKPEPEASTGVGPEVPPPTPVPEPDVVATGGPAEPIGTAEPGLDEKPAGKDHDAVKEFLGFWKRIPDDSRRKMIADRGLNLPFKLIDGAGIARKPPAEILRVLGEVEEYVTVNEIVLKPEPATPQ